MRSLLRSAVCALLGAVALSGCMRFTAELELHADDTVDGEYVVAVADGTGQSLGISDAELAEDLYDDSGLAGALIDPRQRDYSRDGYTGIVVTFRDQPLAAFAPTSERFGILREGDEYVVTGPASAADAADQELADAQIWVTVTFPGPVAEANGTVDGRTVTWNLVGGPDELYARGAATSGPAPASAFVAAAIVVIAVAAVLYVRVGSSTPARPATPAAPRRTSTTPRPQPGSRPSVPHRRV